MNHLLLTSAICAFSFCLVAPTSAQSLNVQDDGSPAITALSAGGPNLQAPGSLTTLFATNNGFAGNMFDITPTVDMSITSMDINIQGIAGPAVTMDVWYCMGTVVGNQQNAAAWTLIGSYAGTSAGNNLPTMMDMTGNGMTFVGGTSYGLYMDVTSYQFGTTVGYTNGPTGGTDYSNADLLIHTWYGNQNTNLVGPFVNSVFQVREWNGTIHYDTAGSSGPAYATSGLVGGTVATLTVTNATPGGGVLIAYSLTGAGPTNTPFGPVDMSNPITQLPVLTADAAGVASMSQGVPGRATGFTVYTQAADLASATLTNSLAEVVL